MYITLFCRKLVLALTYAFLDRKACSIKKIYILHVCLGVGLGVGHYSTRVDPLLLDGQTSRSPVPAFYKSICPSVCVFDGVCVCSLLRYRLTVFLPPLSEVGCPIFLEIRNPWGKVMERSGIIFEHFCLEVV